MRILLAAVNAKYIHSNLAVYSLRACAGVYAPLIELQEFTINQRTEEIFRSVYRRKPQLLFLSCYIWNRSLLTELAGDIRRVLPDTRIWVGGPEVSYDAEEFLRSFPQFDGVMRGEGERTFRELLEYYVDGRGSLAEISGITYREAGTGKMSGDTSRAAVGIAEGVSCAAGVSGTAGFVEDAREIRSTPPRPPMESLDELPFVYTRPEEFAHRILYYESSRGCPFSCSYCLSSLDRRVRFRSVELVERELLVFLEHRVPLVKFVDRTFNCSHERTLRLWSFLRDHDNGVTGFHFEIEADLLNEEELALLAQLRPGLVKLEIGVQTINETTLRAIHRKAEFAQIARRVERISERGNVHLHLDLIAGLPYEDFESFRRSFDAVYRLHPHELQLGFLKVLRGSEMRRRAQEYGLVFHETPPYEVLATKWISCDELLRLKEVEEMLEVYYNSGQFRHTMAALEEMYDSPFDMYESLAGGCGETDGTGRQYSRLQRFEALRGWIRGLGLPEERLQRFDELLTLDFYLRENAKTRPGWAEDQSGYRERMTEFYRREEQECRYLPEYRGMTWKQTMRMTHLERFVRLEGAPVVCGMQISCGGVLDVSCSGVPGASRGGVPDVSCGGTPDMPASGHENVRDERRGGELWLLFDYRRRDPVTSDAAVSAVEVC